MEVNLHSDTTGDLPSGRNISGISGLAWHGSFHKGVTSNVSRPKVCPKNICHPDCQCGVDVPLLLSVLLAPTPLLLLHNRCLSVKAHPGVEPGKMRIGVDPRDRAPFVGLDL